jgi:Flp pilus assembly protein protease CpaA
MVQYFAVVGATSKTAYGREPVSGGMRVEGLAAISECRWRAAASSRVVCGVLAYGGSGAAAISVTATEFSTAKPLDGVVLGLRYAAVLAWVLCCALVATWDLFERRVPRRLTRLLAVLTAATVTAVTATTVSGQRWSALLGAVLCALVAGTGFIAWYLARPGLLGFADVRACTLVAACVGSFSVGAALVISAVAPLVGALWCVLTRRLHFGRTVVGRWRPNPSLLAHQPSRRYGGAPLAALACGAGAVLAVAHAG